MMSGNPSLPTETVDNVARFFQHMDLREVSIKQSSRSRSTSEYTQVRPAFLHTNDTLPKILSDSSRICFENYRPYLQDASKQPAIATIAMKSEHVNIDLGDKSNLAITLSLREQAKFRALSQFLPGQIHTIPLKERRPLPPIGRNPEFMEQETIRRRIEILRDVPKGFQVVHGSQPVNIMTQSNTIFNNGGILSGQEVYQVKTSHACDAPVIGSMYGEFQMARTGPQLNYYPNVGHHNMPEYQPLKENNNRLYNKSMDGSNIHSAYGTDKENGS